VSLSPDGLEALFAYRISSRFFAAFISHGLLAVAVDLLTHFGGRRLRRLGTTKEPRPRAGLSPHHKNRLVAFGGSGGGLAVIYGRFGRILTVRDPCGEGQLS